VVLGNKFLAVVPQGLADNPELKQLVSKLKRTMRERDQEVRWSAPALWHVTVQFLGPIETDSRLTDLLHSWSPNTENLKIKLHGLGAFPASDQARVLWIGVQASQGFLDLQSDLGERLSAAGFPTDQRNYNPHLTLARFRNTISATKLIELGGRKKFGDYPVSELILFESVLQGNIMKYVPQFRKPLQ
jgi:2'-5' RNA ligase